jgi:uncharacterized protein (DUF2235 family)
MSKRLIICCDGTWNRADQESNGRPCPTNVVKLAYRVAKQAGSTPQVIFYDQGVGTGNSLDRIAGGAFGDGLVDNIFDAYRFLIANYELGDELFIFGFSRGAYTARSIGGLIRKCGILDRKSIGQYVAAVKLYQKPDVRPDHPESVAFRTQHAIGAAASITINFLGVWDTVGALGIPMRGLRWLTRDKYQFHDTELSGIVKHACHALAVDEHRGPFAPTLWDYKPKPGQTVRQMWFCGAHSDVGGGYAESDLSDIPLGWMMGEAMQAGLVFGESLLVQNVLKPKPTGMLHKSKTGLYLLTPGIDRPIGLTAPADGQAAQPDPTQSVHHSVFDRWDADASYRPDNVRKYVERFGRPARVERIPGAAAAATAPT